jgi:hypothetical protein
MSNKYKRQKEKQICRGEVPKQKDNFCVLSKNLIRRQDQVKVMASSEFIGSVISSAYHRICIEIIHVFNKS